MPKVKKIYMRTNEARLPAEYQEVEYIQSTGTQCIDTGVTFDSQNTIVEMKFQIPNISFSSLASRPRYYITGNGTNEFSLQSQKTNITSVTANNYQNNSTYQIPTTISQGVDHTSKHYASGIWYVDGNLIGSKSHSNWTSNYNLLIFGFVGGDRGMAYRLYRMQIYNGSTLQRDLVPCYRIADDEIGLYDLVNDTFYTNSGTGTFTKGNDIPSMVEHQVRPTQGQIYEFDFTNSTGWTLTNATISDGKLTGTANNFSGNVSIGSLAGAKKITIDCNVYGTTGDWVGTMWQAVTVTSGGTDYNIGNVLNYMTSSGYTTSGIKFMQTGSYSGPLVISTDNKYGSTLIPVHTEFDIQNATASFSMNNTLIGTATINSTLIDLFNNQTANGTFYLNGSQSGWYYTYLKIEIQF